MTRTLALAAALIWLNGTALANSGKPRAAGAVAQALTDYRNAWLAGDETAVLDALSDQVQVFVPGSTGGKLDGKQAVREFWFPASGASYPIRVYEISEQEIYAHGRLAVVTGKSQLEWDTVKSGTVTDSASSQSEFITVWRKEDGRWRIFRQMYQMR